MRNLGIVFVFFASWIQVYAVPSTNELQGKKSGAQQVGMVNQEICHRLETWKKVDPSMVSNSHSHGVRLTLETDSTGGLLIKGEVTNHGCGKGPGSAMAVFIKGGWTQIMYTQVFRGSTSCWGIFGNDYASGHTLLAKSGLEVFNPSFGDIIFGQKRMQSSTNNIFDGRSQRCDNEQTNFWHGNNGSGERQATVMLRRKNGEKNAGLQTGTSCGTPTYEIKDIYVLL